MRFTFDLDRDMLARGIDFDVRTLRVGVSALGLCNDINNFDFAPEV